MTPRSFFVACSLVCSLGAAASVVAAPTPARADDKPADAREQAIARTLFDDGVALMKDGKYADACPKLEASLKRYPGIGTRGKLADCYERLGKFVSAWTLWREVAQLAMRAGEPKREEVASEHAKALEPKLSYVTVIVPGPNDVAGLVIKRNGQEIDRSKLGAAEPVDAGTVAFEIAAPGRKSFSAEVALAPGQTARFEVPALENASPGTGGAGASTPSGTGTGTGTGLPPPDGDSRSWQRPLGIGLAAVGVVGVGVGAFFGLDAKSTYDKAFDGGGCDKATKQCDAPGQRSVDDARSKATIATIGFVAGAALIAGGAFLFFTAPSSKSAGTGVRVAPAPTATGGGIVVVGAM